MRHLSRIWVLPALVLAVACEKEPLAPTGPTVGSITVAPAADTVETGQAVQLTATAKDEQGNTLTGVTISWSSSDQLVATVDASGLVTGAGIGDVTITATAGSKSAQASIFVHGPVPTISQVSPSTGTVGTELAIVGTAFRDGIAVSVGTLASDSVDLVADTLVFALVPAGVVVDDTVGVSVTNADGTSATLDSAFSAVPPELQFANSATKPSGNVGSTVIIEGDAFGDLRGVGQVLFSDGAGGTIAAAIASEDDWTNTFIVTTVPSGTADGDLVVTTATGTSQALPFTVTEAATFSPSTINWTATADLPVALSGHHALAVPIDDAGGTTVQYVYVLGGASDDAAPRTDVAVSAIQADGSLSGWNSTASLPEGRAFHTAVAATPFNSKVQGSGELYVIGGIAASGGQPTPTVYRATLNQDGTTGSWTTTRPLPQPLHSAGAVIFRGAIYVAGGATTDDGPAATVYRARVDTLGELSTWETLPALPSARAYHGLVTFGGFLYAVGGETAVETPDDGDFTANDTKLAEVAYAKIDLRTGDLTAAGWTINANELQKNRSKHSLLVAGGNLFVSSGLYAGGGTGSSENTFAQINADGTVESFAGATGSNTLLSQGGANLFNQAAVSYIDAAGVAHVMILGGDNVNDPGTKRVGVLFY